MPRKQHGSGRGPRRRCPQGTPPWAPPSAAVNHMTVLSKPSLECAAGRCGSAMSMQPKVLLMCGVIAGPLFVTTLLIEGATKAGYSPLRHPGSSIAWGEFGWVQGLNFIGAGLLSLALALGLRRMLQPFNGSAWGPVLIACWAIGLIGAGIFLTDPVNGFPPGTPNAMLHPSWHGALHDLLSVPGFLCLDIACFVFSRWFAKRGRPGWALYSALTGIVFGIAFALTSAAFSQVAV